MTSYKFMLTAPYISFKTFLDVIDFLKKNVINHVDRDTLTVVPENLRSRVIPVLKFFDLIDSDGNRTKLLQDFVSSDEDGKRFMLSEMLNEKYKEIMNVGLKNITSENLEREIQKYNVTGTTCHRAIQFLLQAAAYANIQINPSLEKQRRIASVNRREFVRSVREKNTISENTNISIVDAPSSARHTIKLKSGGSVTLQVSIPIFDLDKDDRNFVFELIDRLRGYEARDEE